MATIPTPAPFDTMNDTLSPPQGCRATCALQEIRNMNIPTLRWPRLRRRSSEPLPLTSYQQLDDSASPMPPPLSTQDGEIKTIFYLAYGSNLSAETFKGKRGIKPLSAINVAVPSLRLTFDLSGLPYIEPCFANTAHRDPETDTTSHQMSPNTLSSQPQSEKSPLLPTATTTITPPDYHKDRWHKPLVGVVYELTPADFYHVIATEGGGSSYQDIIIPCHPLLPSTDTVPMHPTTPSFLAHTLYAPRLAPAPPGTPTPPGGGRFSRPDPSYAQPSARYLKLITDGAAEHALPLEYRDYLAQIRPYKLDTQAQRLGQFVFMSIWGVMILIVFGVQALFADEQGRSPEWLVQMTGAIFGGMWASYDGFFRKTFGDGERSVKDGGGGGGDEDDDGGDDGGRDGKAGKAGKAEEKRKAFVKKASGIGFLASEKSSV